MEKSGRRTRTWFSRNWQTLIKGAVAVATVLLVTLLVSPFSLYLVEWLFPSDADWSKLSSIGQSYTAFGTFLSALAFGAVAWSIRNQTEQTRISQTQTAREMQMTLMGMAIENEQLASRVYLDDGRDHGTFAKSAYITLILRYLHYAYMTGVMKEKELRAAFEDDFFRHETFRRHWAGTAHEWRRTENPYEEDFVRIADEEFRRAAHRYAQAPADTPQTLQ